MQLSQTPVAIPCNRGYGKFPVAVCTVLAAAGFSDVTDG